ncbi:MAG TPA: hypothetical protein VGB71_11250 [Flavisolibacter sp.]|jgi:high-affinity nickel permease
MLLIIFGSVLIAINFFALATRFNYFVKSISDMEDTAEKIGGVIGSVLLAIIGFILLRIAKRISKKLAHKKAQQELQEFLS